jgi:hypothetical protein
MHIDRDGTMRDDAGIVIGHVTWAGPGAAIDHCGDWWDEGPPDAAVVECDACGEDVGEAARRMRDRIEALEDSGSEERDRADEAESALETLRDEVRAFMATGADNLGRLLAALMHSGG